MPALPEVGAPRVPRGAGPPGALSLPTLCVPGARLCYRVGTAPCAILEGLRLAADGRFLPPVCVAMHAKVLGRTPIGNLMDPEGAISMPIELRHRHNSELLPTSQRVGIKPELCQPAGEMKLDLNTAL